MLRAADYVTTAIVCAALLSLTASAFVSPARALADSVAAQIESATR